MADDRDLLIIGAGPGGLAAAKAAASLGARVAIAEREAVGGTCVNWGCVPKKLLLGGADFALEESLARGYAWSGCERQLDWPKFLGKIQEHIHSVHQVYQRQLQAAAVEQLWGNAKFIDGHTVAVGDRQISADKIIIATGGQPAVPNLPGKELVITSRDIFCLPQIPERLAIIGGGYIGAEFASMMSALGTQVNIFEQNERILSPFDLDISKLVREGLARRGIGVFTGASAKAIEKTGGGLKLHLSGECEENVLADGVLMAVGRVPNTRNLGLEQAGVAAGKKGVIEVDDYCRTNQAHIFAIGDCTGRLELTPVAREEGQAVAHTLFGQPQKVDYARVPSAVFTRPEAATVGLTEQAAREKFGDRICCYRSQVMPLRLQFAPPELAQKAMFKLVVEGDGEKILGLHMVGPHAAEIVQSLAAIVAQSMTKSDFERVIAIHPTIAEEWLSIE